MQVGVLLESQTQATDELRTVIPEKEHKRKGL